MYLLFDIGGTNARFAVSSDEKSLGEVKIIPTPKDFQEALQKVKQIANELSDGQKIDAVAGGVTGPLDPQKTTQLASPHVGGWNNKPLKQELEKIFEAPVFLENDAKLAALGEATFGAGQGKKIVTYLTISTGVGGGRVVNGKIDETALGSFEPGHQIITPDGHPCNCGGKGHLETYVGGAYLEKNYNQKGENIKDPKIWDEISKYLAIGLHNTIVHWSPDIVVLGGSVMQSIPLDGLRAHLHKLLTIFPTPPEITLSSLDDSSGLYGAMEYLHQNISQRP